MSRGTSRPAHRHQGPTALVPELNISAAADFLWSLPIEHWAFLDIEKTVYCFILKINLFLLLHFIDLFSKIQLNSVLDSSFFLFSQLPWWKWLKKYSILLGSPYRNFKCFSSSETLKRNPSLVHIVSSTWIVPEFTTAGPVVPTWLTASPFPATALLAGPSPATGVAWFPEGATAEGGVPTLLEATRVFNDVMWWRMEPLFAWRLKCKYLQANYFVVNN